MFKQIKSYLIIFSILLCICGNAAADSPKDEIIVLNLINRIRTAPFSYGLSLGYDAEFLEERGIHPETAYPPYHMDDFLSSRADDANSHAIGRKVNLDENEPIHLLTTETGGGVSFTNFMPIKIASAIFINNLFKNELETKNFQYILSDDHYYAGIAIKPYVSVNRNNKWFINISLGSFALRSEIQILNLINQIRSEPWILQTYIDNELLRLISEKRDEAYPLENEYPPLFPDVGPGIFLTSGSPLYEAIFVLDVGAQGNNGHEEKTSRIYGVLFSDADGNGVYSSGEELARINVVAYDEDMKPVKSAITDNAGHFSMTLDSGRYYNFSVESDQFVIMEEMFIDRDRFVKLSVLLSEL